MICAVTSKYSQERKGLRVLLGILNLSYMLAGLEICRTVVIALKLPVGLVRSCLTVVVSDAQHGVQISGMLAQSDFDHV